MSKDDYFIDVIYYENKKNLLEIAKKLVQYN